MDLSKEMEKLADLEFEYNIAKLSHQEEEIIKKAKSKYAKQLNKIREMQKTSFNKQK